MNTTINTTMVLQASKGDEQALLFLYKQYNKAMFNLCIRMTGDHHSAQDALQEAFIIAFRQLYQLKHPEQFGGWLKRIVVNECIRHLKKRPLSAELDDEAQEIAHDEETDTEWWNNIDMQLIHNEINSLPEGCRQVFTLHVFEDYLHREIAETLGITESTSKTQYRRAKELLRARIIKTTRMYG